jgi:putative serine protease PepD
MAEGQEPDPGTGEQRPTGPPPTLPAHPVVPLAAAAPGPALPEQREPPEQSGPPAQPDAPPPAGRRPPWSTVVAVVLVVALAGAVAYQGWRLQQVAADLAAADNRLDGLAQERADDGERLGALEQRAADLEQIAEEAFDPEAIATAVMPSVFKVVAGDFTGTAFAVGAPADDGGTNLFTNYHVVEQVWLDGDRDVSLERGNQRYPAEIVDVDRSADVAWLRTDSSFTGLATATGPGRTGQPIVSVGAPLGLDDTLTIGVVSNTDRRLPDGSGPWVQFDASVEPGNSGGPVVNATHEVVGIATRQITDFGGIGFAVPIGDACELFDVCGQS